MRNLDWTLSKTEVDGNYVFKCKSENFHSHRRRQTDEVWISLVERAQLSPIPLLEDITLCMVTSVVSATTPLTLKLGIKECNMLK